MVRQMLKCTVGHVCCVCGFFRVASSCQELMCFGAARHQWSLSTDSVCVCVCDILCEVLVCELIWTLDLPQLLWIMETKWQKYWRTYQFICLYFHSSSLCLRLVRSISPPLYMIPRSLGLLKGPDLTCQVSRLWRMCCWCLQWLTDWAESKLLPQNERQICLRTLRGSQEARLGSEGMYDARWSVFKSGVLTELWLNSYITCVCHLCFPLLLPCPLFPSLPSLRSAQTCHTANIGPTRLISLLIQRLRWSRCARACRYLAIGIAGIYLALTWSCERDFGSFLPHYVPSRTPQDVIISMWWQVDDRQDLHFTHLWCMARLWLLMSTDFSATVFQLFWGDECWFQRCYCRWLVWADCI